MVPFYNEQEGLPQQFLRLMAVAGAWVMDYEIISMDDGSRAGTSMIHTGGVKFSDLNPFSKDGFFARLCGFGKGREPGQMTVSCLPQNTG